MKIFPYILSRVGGISSQEIFNLTYGNMDTINELLRREKRIVSSKVKLLSHFQESFLLLSNPKHKSILNNAKKDFIQERFSFIKKLQQKIISNELPNEVSGLLEKVKDYKEEVSKIYALKKKMREEFKKDQIEKMIWLQNISNSTQLITGVTQSSLSLYHQICRFHEKKPSDFRKKEWQTARSIAQYFYRSSTKTSPFSYFSTLSMMYLENEEFKSFSEPLTSYININNIILLEFQDLLLEKPSFYRQLKLNLNPTLRKVKEEFVFIKNDNNIERIQRLEYSEVLEAIYHIFKKGEKINFSEAIKNLLEIVEASADDLESFLLQIIETGFLEWEWPIKGLTNDWEIKFCVWLRSLEEFEGKEVWIKILRKLNLYKSLYQKSNAMQRIFYVNEITKELKKPEIGISKVIPELIFFEDVRVDHEHSFSSKAIKDIINSLDKFLNILQPFCKDQLKQKIKYCFEKNYNKSDEVELLNFYENFYAHDFKIDSNQDLSSIESKKALDSAIKKIAIQEGDGRIKISSEVLEKEIHKERKDDATSTSYGGLFQFYSEGGKTKAVLNGLATGYGKLFGRFLDLFDSTVTGEINQWNKEFSNEQYWIENKDASFFNANIHPPLLDLEIKSSNTQNQVSKFQQISISHLRVKWDEDLDQPLLYHFSDNKRCLIFDLGFEHPSNRSPLYQLLNGFSVLKSTPNVVISIVNKYFQQNLENGIKCFPRIVIDDHLILQRQFFEIPRSLIPIREKNETKASYFYKIQKWKAQYNFPRFVFFQPIFIEDESNFSRDFYKPQILDFSSSFSVAIFLKSMDKHQGKTKIIEVLPKISSGNENTFVREEVIQWYAKQK